jgi:hypothetical protein
LQEIVQELVPQLSTRSVIDVGTGSGELLRHLRCAHINCIGLDIHEDKSKGISRFDLTADNDAATIQRVCRGLPFSVLPYLTTCFDVLEHIDRQSVAHAIWNLRSITHEYLFTSVSTRPSSLHNLYHATIIPHTAWLSLFDAAGFELVPSDLVDELHVPMDYPASPGTWCMNHWRALDPYKDNRVFESRYLLLRKRPDADFGHFESFTNRLLGNQERSVRLAPQTHLTFLLGFYQEFLLMQPFFDLLPPDRYRVLLRSGVHDTLEDHRRQSILAYFKARAIEVVEVETPAEVTWNDEGRSHAFITAIDSNANTHHLVNSAFLVAAKSRGVPTFQLQHGIWPHAEFSEPLTVVADCLLTWSPDFQRPFKLDDCQIAQVGCPRFDAYSDNQSATIVELFGEWTQRYSHSVMFATNLHWPLHKLGNEVLPQLAQTASEMPETLFVCKLHPTHDYDPAQFRQMPENVIVVDEFVSLYANLSTPRLIKACDVAVCTLSTVALEAALASKPFFILETENPNTYQGVQSVPIESMTATLKSILDGSAPQADVFRRAYYDVSSESSSLQRVIDAIQNFDLNSIKPQSSARIAMQSFSSEFITERVQRAHLQAENRRLAAEISQLQLQLAERQHDATTLAIASENVEQTLNKRVQAAEQLVAELAAQERCAAAATEQPSSIAGQPVAPVVTETKRRATVYQKAIAEKNRIVRKVKRKWSKLRGDTAISPAITEVAQALAPLEAITSELAQPLESVPNEQPLVIQAAQPASIVTWTQHEGPLELGGITNRDQLPELLSSLGLVGLGVELGVAGGAYSDTILERSKLRLLFSVDRWSDHHNDTECEFARSVLNKHGVRSSILRMTFDEAVLVFADSTFDFIYIDGYAHLGQDGVDTLESWWTKLKVGGIFAGHDYDSAWPATIEVVDEFVRRHHLTLYKTAEDPSLQEHAYATWYVRKNG